jgi:UDP-2-acetamido-3-amino-2,3-dideoxy-glucuronate N-acetyltransferase
MHAPDRPFIDETARVEPTAQVGARTRIWRNAHVRDGAVIGADCSLGQNVYVDTGVVVGDRCKVQNNVSLYRGLSVGDEVFLGPSCVFTNDLLPRATSESWEIIATVVERGASIGANATIVCGLTIGEWAMVGAGAVVTHDVAPHQVVLGTPARLHGWVCRCGRVVARGSDAPPDPVACARCRAAR